MNELSSKKQYRRCLIMKIYIDVKKTLGTGLMMVGADNWFEFKDGSRSDNLLGCRINLVLPAQKFSQVNVKIADKNADEYAGLLASTEQGYLKVELIEPEGTVYYINGKQGLSIKAKDIKILD